MAKKTNIEVNGNKYYRVTKTIGHKIDGTPIRKSFYGTGVNEANKKADDYINKLQHGMKASLENTTVIELLKKWLFTIKLMSVKPSTFVAYESNFRNYIEKSKIAYLRLADIKKIHIQEYYNLLFSEGKSTEKIRAINKLLHSFFEYAVEEGYLYKNPCHKIIIPKNNLKKDIIKKVDCFTLDEINTIKELFKGNKYEDLIYTAIYTGMREGELCALKWKNVYLDDGYIHVNESIKTVAVFDSKGNKEIKTLTLDPKSKNSIRDIYIPDILINRLKNIERKSEYVFTNTDGKPVTHKSLYFQWQKILKNSNVKYKKFHALRHTYASLLLANGADLKSVQDLMGHYDIRITQVYLHSLPENKKHIVSIFDKLKC